MKPMNASCLDSAEDAREPNYKTLGRRACHHLVSGGRDFFDHRPPAGAMAWRALGFVPPARMDKIVAALSLAGAVCGSSHHPRAGQAGRGLSGRNRPGQAGPGGSDRRRDSQTGAGGAAVQPQPRQAAVDSRIRLGLRKIPAGHGPVGVDGGMADGAPLEPDRAALDPRNACAIQSLVGPADDTMTQPPFRIGTAEWNVPSLYLDQVPPGGSHLERYARSLNAVEINSSFYRPHRRTTYRRWARSVPDDFRFAVKVPKAITHEASLADCHALLDRFVDEVTGLGDKLGVLLVQLPPKSALS